MVKKKTVSNKEHETKQKKEINYYKIFTFILVGILVLIGLGYGLVKMSQNSFNDGVIFGQENAVNIILTEISNAGYARISLSENESISLVSSNAIGIGQEKLIENMVNMVSEKGFVNLILPNNQSLVLVPYQGELQSQN